MQTYHLVLISSPSSSTDTISAAKNINREWGGVIAPSRCVWGIFPVGRAAAALFISGPLDAQEGADALAAGFGLTPAETRLLASLFASRTLVETVTTLGITRPTAKTHLEHIFPKSGVTCQVEMPRWTGLISPTGSNT